MRRTVRAAAGAERHCAGGAAIRARWRHTRCARIARGTRCGGVSAACQRADMSMRGAACHDDDAYAMLAAMMLMPRRFSGCCRCCRDVAQRASNIRRAICAPRRERDAYARARHECADASAAAMPRIATRRIARVSAPCASLRRAASLRAQGALCFTHGALLCKTMPAAAFDARARWIDQHCAAARQKKRRTGACYARD